MLPRTAKEQSARGLGSVASTGPIAFICRALDNSTAAYSDITAETEYGSRDKMFNQRSISKLHVSINK